MNILRKIIKETTKPITNQIKGKVGEIKVDRKLNPLIFGKCEHKQINNYVLIDDNEKSHQIDHIEIRKNGIFCIETKNYIGYLVGNESSQYWTQCLYNGQKNKFYNPLKQNKTHVYHLSKIFDNKYKIISIVVLVNNNKGKIESDYVVNLDDLKHFLGYYYDGTEYSSEEIEEIYNKLLEHKVEMSNREHVKNVKTTLKEIDEDICPRCGGKLIQREGPYGKFKSCSNYPKCKFTLK